MVECIVEQKEAIFLDLQNLSNYIHITLRKWKLIKGYVEILKPQKNLANNIYQHFQW
jgi:hypothetical protein